MTVRVLTDDEREAEIECFECERPAEFVEEVYGGELDLDIAFLNKRYYCREHAPKE